MKVKVLILFVFSVVCCNSPQADRADRNAKNLKILKVGMRHNEVISIMGLPDTINDVIFREKLYEITYQAPSLYSGDFLIYMLKEDSTIVSIYDGL